MYNTVVEVWLEYHLYTGLVTPVEVAVNDAVEPEHTDVLAGPVIIAAVASGVTVTVTALLEPVAVSQ